VAPAPDANCFIAVGVLERICRERLFEAAFQLILDTARGVVCGYEGLARLAEGVVPVRRLNDSQTPRGPLPS
jgi:hypothetical protein